MVPENKIEWLLLSAVREVMHEAMQLVREFSAELETVTNDIVEELPNDGWEAELDGLFSRWELRGIRAEPDAIAMLKGWIGEQEQLASQYTPCGFERQVATTTIEQTEASSITPVAEPPIRSPHDLRSDERSDLGHPLLLNSKFTYADVEHALEIAQAILIRESRIAELESEISDRGSLRNKLFNLGHFILLDVGYQRRWIDDHRSEIYRLSDELAELENAFSSAGLDGLELSGRFGDDLVSFGGRGLDGAKEILRGYRYEHVNLESVLIDDISLLTGLAGLTKALGGRAAKAGGKAIARRLAAGAEKRTAAEGAIRTGAGRPIAVAEQVSSTRIIRIGKNRVTFEGVEVRAVRDLSHLDEGTLRAMQRRGFAGRDINGETFHLHHLKQDPAGPLVEIPAQRHNIHNAVQHPLGNVPGVGLTAEQRAASIEFRLEYWKARATEELKRRGLQ